MSSCNLLRRSSINSNARSSRLGRHWFKSPRAERECELVTGFATALPVCLHPNNCVCNFESFLLVNSGAGAPLSFIILENVAVAVGVIDRRVNVSVDVRLPDIAELGRGEGLGLGRRAVEPVVSSSTAEIARSGGGGFFLLP